MAKQTQTFSNILKAGIPKVNIERIVLETGTTTKNKFTKDPHFVMPDRFTEAGLDDGVHSLSEILAGILKVNLTLSVRGFKKRNLKNDPLKNIFNDLDIMSLINVSIYEISKESLENIKSAVAAIDLMSFMLGGDEIYGSDVSYQQYYSLVKQFPDDFNVRKFNLLEEMTSITNSELDLARYASTTSDGSTVYDFPINLEPYTYNDLDPEFLAYMIVTEVDSGQLLNHIKSSIGGTSDFILPNEVEEYINNFTGNIDNTAVYYETVFNKSKLNNIASLLQRDDTGELWFGSYHVMDDGTVMTGNVHDDQTLASQDRNVILIPILLPNGKIIDLRDDDEIEKIFLKDLYQLGNVYESLSNLHGNLKNKDFKPEKSETYSTCYLSKDKTGAPAFLFGIDKAKILLNNSLFAGIVKNYKKYLTGNWVGEIADEGIARIVNILQRTTIEDFKIYRKRVKVDKFGANKLGTPKANQKSYINPILDADIENSYSDAIIQEVGNYSTGPLSSIQKVAGLNFLNSPRRREQYMFFTFKDGSLPNLKKGNYEYSYKLVLKDGLAKYMTDRLGILWRRNKDLKKYIDFINSDLPNLYNERLDRFETDTILNNFQLHSVEWDGDEVVENVINELKEIIFLLNPNAAASSYAEKLYNIANPITGNYQGLLKLAAIVDTAVAKINKIPGFYKDFENNKYINIGYPITSKKLYGSKGKQKQTRVTTPETIEINEIFPDLVSLKHMGAGYDYILTEFGETASPNQTTIRQISPETFLNMSDSLFDTYFRVDDNNTSALGNSNNANKTRYFVPAQVHLPNISYPVRGITMSDVMNLGTALGWTDNLVASTGPPAVFLADFEYYKPIILNLLEYRIDKKIDKTSSNEIKSNIMRLVNIASKYGVIFSNDLYEQLGFLSDPSVSSEVTPTVYSDSSQDTNQQQQAYVDLQIETVESAGFDPEDKYSDSLQAASLNPNIENFLLGMLSNIILAKEKELPPIYHDPQLSPGSINVLAGNVSELPFPIQSLFVEQNKKLATLKQYLLGSSNMPFDTLKQIPLSLITVGWWWFNFGNIVEVRYLDTYHDIGDAALLNPIWKPLTTEAFNKTVGEGKNIICKLFRYEDKRFGVTYKNNFLQLPMLDEHFIIGNNMVEISGPEKQFANTKAALIQATREAYRHKLHLLGPPADPALANSKSAKSLSETKEEQLLTKEETKDLESNAKYGFVKEKKKHKDPAKTGWKPDTTKKVPKKKKEKSEKQKKRDRAIKKPY